MYGWFEPGSGVNKYFSNTQMIDVLLRTVSLSNNIILGNSSCGPSRPAALYISQNSVGIQRIPNSQYSLDVSGNTRFDEAATLTCGDWYASGSNTGLSSNVYFTNKGMATVQVLITNDVKQPVLTLYSVSVISITANNDNTLNLTLESSNDMENISETSFLYINDILYRVNAVTTINSFIISSYFTSDNGVFPLPFQDNDVIDVQILAEYVPGANAIDLMSSRLISWFKVNGFGLTAPDTLTISITFLSIADTANIFAGQRYSFGLGDLPINIVKVVKILMITETLATLILSSIDQTAFPASQVQTSAIMSLLLLDTITPPLFEDVNVSIGTYAQGNGGNSHIGTYIIFTNSRLSKYVNQSSSATCAINQVTIGGVSTYATGIIFQNNGHVVAQLSADSTAYAFSTRGTATYQLNGMPFQLSAVSNVVGSPGTYRYDVIDLLGCLSQMKLYIGQRIYFAGINVLSKIINIVTTVQAIYLLLNTDIRGMNGGLLPTFIYLVPFKAAVLTQLGKDRCYIQTSLGIGTKVTSETLTVAGSISLTSSLLFRDLASASPFAHINYTAGTMYISDGIELASTNVTMQKDTVVNGTIITEGYFSFSDRRIKKKIYPSNPQDDLELIKKIQVKNYMMKADGSIQKGIIAQDIEELLPDASIVRDTAGFIPSICKNARITSIGSLRLRGISDEVAADLVPGAKLKLMSQASTLPVVTIEGIRKKKGTLFIKTSGKLHFQKKIGSKVYILGPWTEKIKVIDKDYLFMVLLNAFKGVLERI